jgi:hypothetical protein
MESSNELSKAPPIVSGMVVSTPQPSKMDELANLGNQGKKALGANNFDGDKKQRWKLLMQATGPDSIQGQTLIGELVRVKYWYAHTVIGEDKKTGEVVEYPRIVLISKDGVCVRFCSQGILDWLQYVVAYNGEGAFDPEVVGQVARVKASGTNFVLTMRDPPEEEEEKKPLPKPLPAKK